MTEQFWFLKRCVLFERLSPEEVRQLEAVSRFRRVKRGEMIYLPADAGEAMLLLSEGRVKIYHLTGEGKQAVLGLIEPGEIFGELAILEQSPREEFAEAMINSSLLLVPGQAVRDLMDAHPVVSLEVTRLMGLRRKRIERRLKSLLFRSNRERLTALLLDLAEKYGRTSSRGIELTIKLSHQEMANMIGSTRETVTVVLGELLYERLIDVQKRVVTLLKPEALAISVEQPPPVIPVPTPKSNPRPDGVSADRPAIRPESP